MADRNARRSSLLFTILRDQSAPVKETASRIYTLAACWFVIKINSVKGYWTQPDGRLVIRDEERHAKPLSKEFYFKWNLLFY